MMHAGNELHKFLCVFVHWIRDKSDYHQTYKQTHGFYYISNVDVGPKINEIGFSKSTNKYANTKILLCNYF